MLSEIGKFGDAVGNGAKKVSLTAGNFKELSSTFNPNIPASNGVTSTNVYPYQSRRNDVRIPDEANPAAASNAVDFSRIEWLN